MKRRGVIFPAALAVFAALLAPGSCGSLPGENGGSLWTIHYFRPDAQYSGWDLWVWPARPNDNGRGWGFGAPGADGFVTAAVRLPGEVAEIGFIVRQGGDAWSAKDVESDRFTDAREIWLVSGDPAVHTGKPPVPRRGAP